MTTGSGDRVDLVGIILVFPELLPLWVHVGRILQKFFFLVLYVLQIYCFTSIKFRISKLRLLQTLLHRK